LHDCLARPQLAILTALLWQPLHVLLIMQ
jgi:hypothetical protein